MGIFLASFFNFCHDNNLIFGCNLNINMVNKLQEGSSLKMLGHITSIILRPLLDK